MDSIQIALNFLGLLVLLVIFVVALLRVFGGGGGWGIVKFWQGLTTRSHDGKGGRS